MKLELGGASRSRMLRQVADLCQEFIKENYCWNHPLSGLDLKTACRNLVQHCSYCGNITTKIIFFLLNSAYINVDVLTL